MSESSRLEGEALVQFRLRDAAQDITSILDVGCGPGKYLNKLVVPVRVGIDAHGKYLDSFNGQTICGKAEEILPTLADKAFDITCAMDFIEHLDKDVAVSVIAQMQRIARKRVVVFTPNGFHENGAQYEGVERDLQTHRSGWAVDDLEALGFKVEVWSDFEYGSGKKLGALWAVWSR